MLQGESSTNQCNYAWLTKIIQSSFLRSMEIASQLPLLIMYWCRIDIEHKRTRILQFPDLKT